jgi:hypothetical protein
VIHLLGRVTGFTPTALVAPYGFCRLARFLLGSRLAKDKPMANKFELSGGGIQIEYILGGNPTFPSLTFTEGSTKKTFTPAEITTDTSGLGTLVSVALVRTVDTGGTRFGFFLPDVQLTREQSAPVTTVGVFETFSGPDSVPRRPTTWQSVHLHGVAEEVIVPL